MTGLPKGVAARVILRSLLLQSAWNYRTLQGNGVAFALLPVLRRVHSDEASLREAVERHSHHFNAHPYLASLALGSLARLEWEGMDGETIRRFRAALGGPLGALGDRLVWAAWLPLCSVLALSLLWVGLAPGWTLAVFLFVYNAGHFTLRVWGFREGWEAGTDLAARLRTMGLSTVSTRLEGWLAGAMGLLVGLAVLGPGVRGGVSPVWIAPGVALLALGFFLGPRAWRATAAVTVAGVALLLLVGFFLR